MKIAFVTYYRKENLKTHHSVWFHISESLRKLGHEVVFIDDLDSTFQKLFKIKSLYYKKIAKKNYFRMLENAVLKDIARQVDKKLDKYNDIDLVFSPGTIEIAYLKTKIPIVVWTDTTFLGLKDFYETYKNLADCNIDAGYMMDKTAHEKSKFIIYPSEWAVNSAIENYNIKPENLKIINFGSGIDSDINLDDVTKFTKKKKDQPLKLFFAAIEWERKGGEIVLKTFEKLKKKYTDAELHIAGIKPNIKNTKNIFMHGFLTKDIESENKKLMELYKKSHFFFMPSKAETFGLVFAEASSYGLPSISSNLGGIPSVIKNGVNGFTFGYENIVEESYSAIDKYYSDFEAYKELAVSSYYEFKNRLNWSSTLKPLQKVLEAAVK